MLSEACFLFYLFIIYSSLHCTCYTRSMLSEACILFYLFIIYNSLYFTYYKRGMLSEACILFYLFIIYNSLHCTCYTRSMLSETCILFYFIGSCIVYVREIWIHRRMVYFWASVQNELLDWDFVIYATSAYEIWNISVWDMKHQRM